MNPYTKIPREFYPLMDSSLVNYILHVYMGLELIRITDFRLRSDDYTAYIDLKYSSGSKLVPLDSVKDDILSFISDLPIEGLKLIELKCKANESHRAPF
jgi:hypothetical protein